MTKPFFFGYGSLVNRKTHEYGDIQTATLHGWRRVWRQTTYAPRPILTAEPSPGGAIQGLIAHVPDGDWQALDQREHAYDRVAVTDTVDHTQTNLLEIATYTVPEGKFEPSPQLRPIYLSYLDVVIQGYLREFGPEGAEHFFDTTVGWEAPIKDDRADPIYPRHQKLSAEETTVVDAALSAMECRILR